MNANRLPYFEQSLEEKFAIDISLGSLGFPQYYDFPWSSDQDGDTPSITGISLPSGSFSSFDSSVPRFEINYKNSMSVG